MRLDSQHPELPKLKRSFMRDEAYQTLRDLISSGQLSPGTKLKDDLLARQLEISRTPVREALRRLEDEGLVETAPNRWTRVAPIDAAQAEQIYPIINKLETLALETAFVHLTNADLARMQAANNELEHALANHDIKQAVRADLTFHHILIDAAANTELRSILNKLRSKYQRLELAYFSQEPNAVHSHQEHEAILKALAKRDLNAALQALAENWTAALTRVQEQAKANGD